MTTRLFLIAALAVLCVPSVHAQRSTLGASAPEEAAKGDDVKSTLPSRAFRRAPVRLVYDHVDQSVSLLDASGKTKEVWEKEDGVPYAEVPTDRPVVVEVRNANSLVYAYPVSAVVSEPLPAPPSCRREGRSFFLAGALLAGSSVVSGDPFSLPEYDNFSSFLTVDLSGVDALLAGMRSVGGLQTGTISQINQNARSALRELREHARRLGQIREETRASLRSAALRGDVEPLDPLLAQIQDELEAERSGLSDPARVPLAVEEMSPDAAPLAELYAAAAAVRAGEVAEPGSRVAQDAVSLAASAQQSDSLAASAAADIQTLALRIQKARKDTRQTTTVRPGDDLREIAIQIQAAETPVEGVVAVRAGTVNAYLAPASGIGFGCRVAVALTFSPKAPSFDAVLRGEEWVAVDDTEGELAAAPAVLFEVAPPVIGSVLGAVGGIGLGDNLAPNLFAGGSFRLFSPVLVTGGALWRRTHRLPDGVAVGSTLATLDDTFDQVAFVDDLPRGWARTFFVGLSVVP